MGPAFVYLCRLIDVFVKPKFEIEYFPTEQSIILGISSFKLGRFVC